MKSLIMAGALACALCAVAYAEEDIKGKSSDPAGQTVVFEETSGSGGKTIGAGGPPGSPYPNDGGVDDAGKMPPYEEYDDSTGLQNNVPSDSYGEIDQ